jgi:hypothetical protein
VRNLQGMAGESKPGGGFTVTDRRSFADAGEPRDAPSGAASEAASDAPSHAASDAPSDAASDAPVHAPSDAPSHAASRGAAAAAEGLSAAFPPVDFHTFVLSLGSSALLHLGEIENPNDGASQKDLPLAKHTIDILAMLAEKTKGNLSPAEEKLMESLLYDLRLRYVELSKPQPK